MKSLKEIVKFIIYSNFYLIFKILKKTMFHGNSKVYYIRAERIANQLMEEEIFYLENINTESRTYVFSSKPSNLYFHKLFIKSLKKNKRIQVFEYYIFWELVFKSYEYFNKEKFPQRILDIRKKSHYFINREKFLELKKEELDRGYEIKNKNFGIKKNDKWICVYNRDSGYLNNFYKNNMNLSFNKIDWGYHDFRNFPIDDLNAAIKLFLEEGYYVIRMGSFTVGSSKIKNNRYIDYSKSKINSDFMDLFISSRCQFFFGGASGICMLAATFRKPHFIVNNTPIEGVFSINRKFPGIFKRVRDIKTKKILTIREMVQKELCNIFQAKGFKEKNVENINNSHQEILEFAKECLDSFKHGLSSKNDSLKIKEKEFCEEISKDKLVKKLFINNLVGKHFLFNTKIY